MFDASIGKRKKVDCNTLNGNEIEKFQESYIDLWKSVYKAGVYRGDSLPEQKSKKACKAFFEYMGRPNKLYFSEEEYKIVKSDENKEKYLSL